MMLSIEHIYFFAL